MPVDIEDWGVRVGGLPKDAEAKKCIKVLRKEFGWDYDDEVGSSAHIVGFLFCGGGCRIPVNGTANNTARALWRAARKCPHNHGPTRLQW